MSEKRGAAEANSNEEVLQQENNAKRAKLTPQSDTVLQDLPDELLECILIKTVVMEVRSMKLAKSVWAEKADLVINQLASVCSQWNSIITTDYFLREVHRILDNTGVAVGQMDELKSFTNEMDGWIDGVLETLSWTRQGLLETEARCECPIDPEHTMNPQALERHLQYCPLVAAGYTKEELNKDQSSKFFYQNAPSVLTLDLDETVMRNVLSSAGGPVPDVLPKTNDRATTALTVAQRLKIYEYCVEVGRASNVRKQISDEDLLLFDISQGKEEKPQSKLEMLAKLRDLKRRRQSYRGKNTHTGKKNHTEVIRDVIASQMEMLSRIWEEEKQEKDELRRKLDKMERQSSEESKSRSSHKRRHRDRSPKRHRSQERKQSSQKEQLHERMQSREREQSRERKHDRDGDRSRERKHSRERERSQESKSSQERDKSREQSEDRERSSEKHRSKKKSKSEKKRHRSKDPDEQHKKHKRHKKSKERNDGRSKDRSDKQSKESTEYEVLKQENRECPSDVADLKEHEANAVTDS